MLICKMVPFFTYLRFSPGGPRPRFLLRLHADAHGAYAHLILCISFRRRAGYSMRASRSVTESETRPSRARAAARRLARLYTPAAPSEASMPAANTDLPAAVRPMAASNELRNE